MVCDRYHRSQDRYSQAGVLHSSLTQRLKNRCSALSYEGARA
jgi:hypothetical protein